jgi:hypothetical protein
MKSEINHFDDLLRTARFLPERQRLLFVFASVELPQDATAEQRARFEQGDGGALVPMMCVDKLPDELGTFDDFLRESTQFELPGQPWRLVFSAALAGTPGEAPSDAAVDAALARMVESVKTGAFDAYLAFNREGVPVQLG